MENSGNSVVLVAGATGYLGTEICRQLRAKNRAVRALIRSTSNAEKVAVLTQMGVETMQGDLKEPESLRRALQEVSSVISTVSSTLSRQPGDSIESVDGEGQLNLIQAAKDVNVEKFVFISFCKMAPEFPLQTTKRNVEKYLESSGVPYAILQPTCFMEVWLSPALGFDYPNKKINIYGDGTKKLSWIAIEDVAKYAVAALESTTSLTLELGGPEALSPLDVVKIFETETGEKYELQFIPRETLETQKNAATESLDQSFAGLMLSVSEGSEIDMKEALKTYPLHLTSVRDYAKRSFNRWVVT